MRRVFTCSILATIGLVMLGAPAQAQSAIAGVVRDTSGGVLPGVTVEASSPVLIEGVRTAVTDSQGRYQIIDLRPGVYTVTFNLTGFATVKREGIELPTAFTATLNMELKVGGLEESVTVTGESPVVDTRSSVGQSVMARAVLEALPTGRQVFAVAELIPGVTTGRPDIGGSEGMQQPTLQVHGSSTRDMVYQQDGMDIGGNFGSGNQTTFYYNEGAHDEISYQTSMLPAEVDLGGVRINMIPAQGGNEFHGTILATGANSAMESDNSSKELEDRGLIARNGLVSTYDFNASIGGPIIRDKLWFFGSARHWAFSWYVANSFNRDGRQSEDPNRITNGTVRLTYLANQKNKITFAYQRGWKYRWGRRTNQPATFVQPEAAMTQYPKINYIAQTKWTSTLSNKLPRGRALVADQPQHDRLPGGDQTDRRDQVRFREVGPVQRADLRSDLEHARLFGYCVDVVRHRPAQLQGWLAASRGPVLEYARQERGHPAPVRRRRGQCRRSLQHADQALE